MARAWSSRRAGSHQAFWWLKGEPYREGRKGEGKLARGRGRRAASRCLPPPNGETGGGGNLFACKAWGLWACGNLGQPARAGARASQPRLRGCGGEGGGGAGRGEGAEAAGSRARPRSLGRGAPGSPRVRGGGKGPKPPCDCPWRKGVWESRRFRRLIPTPTQLAGRGGGGRGGGGPATPASPDQSPSAPPPLPASGRIGSRQPIQTRGGFVFCFKRT